MSIAEEVNNQRAGHSRITEEMLETLDVEKWDGVIPIKDFLQMKRESGILFPGFVDLPTEREYTPETEWLDDGLTRDDHMTLSFVLWLRFAKHYLENQDDWKSAYAFIEGHPIFWRRNAYRDGSDWNWETNNGHHGIWVGVSEKVMLEHGPTVAPNYVYFYHDYDMDVWADTFEDAYIDYAKNIHAKYTLDGYARDGKL